jgi:hypothetical protein
MTIEPVTICQVGNSLVNLPNSRIPRLYEQPPHIVIPSSFHLITNNDLPLAFKSQSNDIINKSPTKTNAFPLVFKWHPFKQTFAFSCSNHIFTFDLNYESHWPPNGLSNIFQSGISCISWHPLGSNAYLTKGASQIAVGGTNGVCLWNIYHPSVSSSESSFISPQAFPEAWVKHLDCDIKNVSCMSWSKCGRFLVVGFFFYLNLGFFGTCMICVWDMQIESFQIMRGTVSGYSVDVYFSPCGDWMIQCLSGSGLLVWETNLWTNSHYSTIGECHVKFYF